MNGEGFRTRLQALINEHSMECGSNTPDFILAKYLAKCLTNFDESVVARDAWYGKRATGISMVDFESNQGEARPINPTSPSYEAGEVAGFTSDQNNPSVNVAAAKGAINASGAAQSVFPLRDDEERDWRTFAFAKTKEGSVWERTAVQRLFATIDAQREKWQEERKKWQEYEREYVLPCFQWARELGFDLERMVIDNPGHNCVELLVSTLRERLEPGTVKHPHDRDREAERLRALCISNDRGHPPTNPWHLCSRDMRAGWLAVADDTLQTREKLEIECDRLRTEIAELREKGLR